MNPISLATVAISTASAFFLSSCAYEDPYYAGSPHGYQTGTVSSSVFVSTGNPRWGYDPHSHAYYDHQRRSYYDPYLNGYYPAGYRPVAVSGVPHPHGWRPGRNQIRPPGRVRTVQINNYQNRHDLYRSTNHSWARNLSGPSYHSEPEVRRSTRRSVFEATPDHRYVERSRQNTRTTHRATVLPGRAEVPQVWRGEERDDNRGSIRQRVRQPRDDRRRGPGGFL